jgi:response regulator RpfG family c-di-GMP phosphodiesterase
MTYKLLIVDDEMPNTRLLERLFRDDYFCLTASSGDEAIKLLDQHDVAVIVTDQRMSPMTGIELLKQSADRRPHMVRILLTGYTDVDALVEAINCGLVYTYVSKPWNNEDLKLRVSRAVQHYEDNKRRHALVAANERLSTRLKDTKLGFIRALAGVLKLNDEYTYAHGSRVGKCASMIGEKLGLGEEALTNLTAAAFLHELGSIGAANMVLPRSIPLSSEERASLRRYPEHGAQILSCVPELSDVADIVRHHRENYDGGGYPGGLIGEQIPLTSRIIRVANEYDLMVNPRVPSHGITHYAAIEQLRHGVGMEYDEQVVKAFTELDPNHLSQLNELNALPIRPELITVN